MTTQKNERDGSDSPETDQIDAAIRALELKLKVRRMNQFVTELQEAETVKVEA